MYAQLTGTSTAGTAVGLARATLAALTVSIGTEGLAVAARRPALLAEVDQHAAAVRDSLGAERRLTVAALAGYADGVRAAATEHGWTPPSGPVDWSAPDWVLVRLLAVCALARPTCPSA